MEAFRALHTSRDLYSILDETESEVAHHILHAALLCSIPFEEVLDDNEQHMVNERTTKKDEVSK